jgi:hypothetical protein
MRIRPTDKTASLYSTEPAPNIDTTQQRLQQVGVSIDPKVVAPPNLPSGGGGGTRSAAEIAFAEQLKKASSEMQSSGRASGAHIPAVVAGHNDVSDRVTDVVKCRTNYGDLVIDMRGSWAPLGTKQFVALVDAGFFTDMPFYRVCPKYMALVGKKFGYERNLTVSGVRVIKDDPSMNGIRDMDFGYVFFSVGVQDLYCFICSHAFWRFNR